MSTSSLGYRLSATTGIHRGDRAYQQDQVLILPHARVPGCVMAVLADGMGGKSGGRKAADQVLLTAQQLFERYSPTRDDPTEALKQLVLEAHLMIKLTAITSEEEPHSTIAAFMISPTRECDFVHAGDSRIYHFRAAEMVTLDRPLLRPAPRRRAPDHRGRSQQPSAVEPAHRLPGHLPGSAAGAKAHRPARGRRQRAVVQRRPVALLHAARARRDRARAAAARGDRDARRQGAPAARGSGDNLSLALVRVEPLG